MTGCECSVQRRSPEYVVARVCACKSTDIGTEGRLILESMWPSVILPALWCDAFYFTMAIISIFQQCWGWTQGLVYVRKSWITELHVQPLLGIITLKYFMLCMCTCMFCMHAMEARKSCSTPGAGLTCSCETAHTQGISLTPHFKCWTLPFYFLGLTAVLAVLEFPL